MSRPQNRLTKARRRMGGGNCSSTIRQRGRGPQGSPGQQPPGTRERDGPLPQLHNTLHTAFGHTALRLAFSQVQDHPSHCLLVTAPLVHHTTLHHTTPHHTTPHHTTPHHTTPHHTTPHHTTPHHNTPHHTTPHHTLSTPQLYSRAGCRVRSPRRQGPGTANRRCTNSVGCAHVPVPSTIPRDPAAPSTGRPGPGNGQRPSVEDG